MARPEARLPRGTSGGRRFGRARAAGGPGSVPNLLRRRRGERRATCSRRCGRRLGAPWLRIGAVALLVALACAVGLAGCRASDPARASADRFVDSYYVEIDLPRARANAVGLARAKVEREIELLRGVARPEPEARPTIYYRFLEEKRDLQEGQRGFLYRLTIAFKGGDTVTRRALVVVRKDGGVWRAVNFRELD